MTESSSAHLVTESRVNRLVLIDGNAILHRAYHAIPPLTSPKGVLVNAVYGFASMLLRLKTDLAPTYLVVCFDRPKPTFRKELFKGYQAKRPKMDDELVGQIEIVHDLVRAFTLPIFEMDGFEADDVIGTIVTKCKDDRKIKTQDEHKISRSSDNSSRAPHVDEVIIVTGDKDLLQLVDDHVFCYMPTKGLSEAKLYGEKEARERLGVDPKQIPDYKALAGDPSDNYPGVAGIGPKTAGDLLNKFHTVEALYKALDKNAHIEGTSEGVLEKLRKDRENAFMSKTLATIKTDVPIDITYVALKEEQFSNENVIEVLQNLGFQSLVKRLTKREDGNVSEKKKAKKLTETKDAGEQLSLV